ncbi:MAG: hypothetical protein Q7K39_04865, partial [Candidatus Magasanikbacteria bacterium]|nr:hypothetical protein [Candidatus Magasanikbacteria bacterium]
TTPTMSNIVESRGINILGQKIIDYKAFKWGPGDKTVPLESATNLPINAQNKFYSLNASHGIMMTQDGSRQKIVNIFSGSSLNVASEVITQDIAECQLNGKAISVFSPIDIFVTDQLGNELGNAADGSVLNEIPNAAFEVFGEHKFLYLPTDDGQVYEVKIKGTGTGTYTIKTQEISDTQVTGTEVFSNLPVTPELLGEIHLGAETTLTVKETAASAEQIILPSAVINSSQSEDVLPPTSTATITGTKGQENFYRSNVVVNLEADDSIILGQESQASGILSLNYKVDGGAWQKVDGAQVNIPVSSEGLHSVTFFATDNAGNNEPEKVLNFTIDTTAPEALVQFDSVAKDLVFGGIPGGELVSIIKQGTVITITDQAGNATVLTFKYTVGDNSTSAELKSLHYNGILLGPGRAEMKFSWSYKDGALNKLSQYVKSVNGYEISTVYEDGKTKISTADAAGKISQKVPGLIIVKSATQKGDLDWSY